MLLVFYFVSRMLHVVSIVIFVLTNPSVMRLKLNVAFASDTPTTVPTDYGIGPGDPVIVPPTNPIPTGQPPQVDGDPKLPKDYQPKLSEDGAVDGNRASSTLKGEFCSRHNGDCGIHPGGAILEADKGDKGARGLTGMKGERGFCPPRNIYQYAWQGLNLGTTDGVLIGGDFMKHDYNSAIRVTWSGDLRLKQSDLRPACRRWYLTFDGRECNQPLPIEVQLYTDVSSPDSYNVHRHTTIDGICYNIPLGLVKIELRVGACSLSNKFDFSEGHPFTGWETASRIIIDEFKPTYIPGINNIPST